MWQASSPRLSKINCCMCVVDVTRCIKQGSGSAATPVPVTKTTNLLLGTALASNIKTALVLLLGAASLVRRSNVN